MTAGLAAGVVAFADATAADLSIDRSTVLTDICCYHYGRYDLMRHLTQQFLFETRTATRELTTQARQAAPHVKLRPPRAIADMIVADYQRRGVPRPTLLADICCYHLGFPDLVRVIDTEKEGLPLAM